MRGCPLDRPVCCFRLSGGTFSRERLLDATHAVPSLVQIADGLRPDQLVEDTDPELLAMAILRVSSCGRVILLPWSGATAARLPPSQSPVAQHPR